MPLPFNKNLDLKLLKLVKDNPILYNPKQSKYLDFDSREVVWQKIGDALNRPAVEFAAIQCQIQFGDYLEEKHKPGFIENLNEFLPEQYSSSWGVEKKIFKLHQKHLGLGQLEAKHLYTKTARALPTYGVTFFLVKEKQKDKKRLVPRLLGINSESILRLDEVTKEILQVWPLTHVKTYHAKKTDAFTLNFGDYSDKEYSVKTNDALRIRDILEGYIDLIRKRMAAPYGSHHPDSGTIGEDSVYSSRSTTMTVVSNTASKVVEQSYIGPTKILPFEQGSESSQGTQIMTVQQMVITNKGTTQQHAMTGAVPMRSDMSPEFVKKLNRMNSSSVKIVTLLTDPTAENITQARGIVDKMEADMPSIIQGVKETAEKQSNVEAKNKLLKELEELRNLVDSLGATTRRDDLNSPLALEAAQESARRVADLTTQMYFSLDPRTRRRSDFVRRSRQSFIADEKTEGVLRRASFLTAASHAAAAVDDARATLDQEATGPAPTREQLQQLQAAAVDKLGKLNAAVALFLTAHSDSNNIDYPAAVTSMNTIKELLPEFAKDAHALLPAADGEGQQQLVAQAQALCGAAHRVCQLTGADDVQKLQTAATSYAEVSGGLVYTFGQGNPSISEEKENEVVELAREVGDVAAVLLVRAHEMAAAQAQAGAEGGASAHLVDERGVAVAQAVGALLAAAQLTAPTIHEPHCQSALAAAAEAVSSAAQRLAAAWTPLAAARPPLGHRLQASTMDLARALDRLKNSYADLGVIAEEPNDPTAVGRALRLRFVTGVASAQDAVKSAQEDLDKPATGPRPTSSEVKQLENEVSRKMAQINAAVASLLHARADPQNPDYETAEAAMSTISELMPAVMRDAKSLSAATGDEASGLALLGDVRAWGQAVAALCAAASDDDREPLEDSAQQYAAASKKLSFVFSARGNSARERLLAELCSAATARAEGIALTSTQLAAALGAAGPPLAAKGQDVRRAARDLHCTAQLTLPTIDDPRCQSALLTCSDHLSSKVEDLVSESSQAQDHETGCRVLAAKLQQQQGQLQLQGEHLQRDLAGLREICAGAADTSEGPSAETQRAQRLKFITSVSKAQEQLAAAERVLDQPFSSPPLDALQVQELKNKLSHEMAQVNAAVAALSHAGSGVSNPDYSSAEQAMETIAKLMPSIIADTRALSSTQDETLRRAMLDDIKAWSQATSAICASAGGEDKQVEENAQKFADATNKLTFVCGPRRNSVREHKVVQLSSSASDKARQMAEEAQRAAEVLPASERAQLMDRAAALATAAARMQRTAKVTVPSMHEPVCQSALISSAENLSEAAQELVSASRSLHHPACAHLGEELARHKDAMNRTLEDLKGACKSTDSSEGPPTERQRLKFTTSAAKVQKQLAADESALDKPFSGPPLDGLQVQELKTKLSQEMAAVNAAVAALAGEGSGESKPDYSSAEQNVATISKLMPIIFADAQALSSTQDEASRHAMLKDIKAWSQATSSICASVGHEDKQVEERAQKFADATNKLTFVCSPRRDSVRERKVVQLSASASDKARQMAEEAQRAAEVLPASERAQLMDRAAALATAATKLQRTAKMTVPSMHESVCQSALISSADNLSEAAQELVSVSRSLHHPACANLGEELARHKDAMNGTLDDLREACKSTDASEGPSAERQRLKFTTSAAKVQKQLAAAERALDEPFSGPPLDGPHVQELMSTLSHKMAEVNAAVVGLVGDGSGESELDYSSADQSVATISKLMPSIIADTQALSSTQDEVTRRAMLEDMKAWSQAISGICASAGREDKQVEEIAQKFSDATYRLSFVCGSRRNSVREHKVVQLSSSASDKARQMAEEAQRAAEVLPASERAQLMDRAAALATAAARMQRTAKMTVPSMHEPVCQSSLISSVDSLSVAAQELVSASSSLHHPDCARLAEELARYKDIMDKTLDGLKEACKKPDRSSISGPPRRASATMKRPPPLPVKTSTLSKDARASMSPQSLTPPRRAAPSIPDGKADQDHMLHGLRSQTEQGGSGSYDKVVVPLKPLYPNTRRASQDFLDRLRIDESIENANTSLARRKAEEERRARRLHFANVVADVDRAVLQAEAQLKEPQSQSSAADVDDPQQRVRARLERSVALASSAAAGLVASNHIDAVDYTAATQSAQELAKLMPEIVKDATVLSSSQGAGKSRKALLDDVLALCEATRKLCAAAKSDPPLKLNEAAVTFGDQSARLLYIISTEVDPAQEKEVIARAKAIGESASRVALAGAGATGAAGEDAAQAQRMCHAGRQLADAAGTLVYTAKLVAPSIHHPESKSSLVTASNNLSSHLKTFTTAWAPLASNPELATSAADLTLEAGRLEKLLGAFCEDLDADRMVKKQEVVEVEDTELRQLAVKIMEGAKKRAQSEPAGEYGEYGRRLAEAIRALDLANTRSRRQPRDMGRQQELENAVQHLQVVLLQARPSRAGAERTNIVDLMDFVKDVSSEAEKLSEAASKAKVPQAKQALESIRGECRRVSQAAGLVLQPGEPRADADPALDYIVEIDNFGQECEARVHSIGAAVQRLLEKDAQCTLRAKALALAESCDMLRFASKSALATAQSAVLEETLSDLVDLEKRLDKMMTANEGVAADGHKAGPQAASPQLLAARASLVGAAAGVARGRGGPLASELQHYAATLRGSGAADASQRAHLKDHVGRLVQQLKALAMRAAGRAAQWQAASPHHVAADTERLIQELESVESQAPGGPQLLKEPAVRRLLLPMEPTTVAGDAKLVEQRVRQCADKLSTLSVATASSACSAASTASAPALARSARAAAVAAADLASAAHAQGLLATDPVQRKRIEDSSQEMRLATYAVVAAADQACCGGDALPAARRRLLSASRQLGEHINRLTRAACPRDRLSGECGEVSRRLHSQQAALLATAPACALPYQHAADALTSQRDVINKMSGSEEMSREQFSRSLSYVTAAVCNSAEYAAHCAYLITVSDSNKEAGKEGVVDVPRLQARLAAAQGALYGLMRARDHAQAKEEELKLNKQLEELKAAVKESLPRARPDVRRELTEASFRVESAARGVVAEGASMDKITSNTMSVLDAVNALGRVVERPTVVPTAGETISPTAQAMRDHVMDHTKHLLTKTQELVQRVNSTEEEDEPMTWVMFSQQRGPVIDAFEALVNSVKQSGERVGLVEATKEEAEEDEAPAKSELHIQVEIANKWLHRRPSKPDIQTAGQAAVRYVIDVAQKMEEDLKGQEKEEMNHLITESGELLSECSKKYDNDKYSSLMEHVRELRKAVERGVVSRVVDDFALAEPLADLDVLADAEEDEEKRKFLLEKKIAELLAQLGRVTRTARFVALTGAGRADQLGSCSQQAELLAPQLVKAAQERVRSPGDPAAVERYKALLAQYAEALTKVQDLCDQSLDPMDFVQTAGETMQRMREESSHDNDPQKCAYTSVAIKRLANRVIQVGLSSAPAQNDPELRSALTQAQKRLTDANPTNFRASRQPDWRDVTAEMLRATGEVESAIGGENIFQKQPEPDKPIYNAALSLHAAVREWSGRDNEIVAVAKRMAVLMARLSGFMNTDKKRDLISASKSIVTESHDVARLAKKLALECTDLRIRTNLLQACERIPTISGQLKMLTTVKGSSLGHHGTNEDNEAMNMLVGNAQNLMASIEEVVKAAASATVKIASQRGGSRMRWVRKNYY